MNPLFLGPLLEVGKTIIDRFVPDKQAAAEAQRDLLRMAAEGELKTVLAQLEINAREAASPSIWVSGWRPGFGWCAAAGFAYAVLLQPMLAWVAAVRGWPVPPTLDSDLLWTVATGLLGLGGLRTVEKIRGAA